MEKQLKKTTEIVRLAGSKSSPSLSSLASSKTNSFRFVLFCFWAARVFVFVRASLVYLFAA